MPSHRTPATRRSRKAREGTTGIDERHARSCAKTDGKRCSCKPTYRAVVNLGAKRARLRKTFPTLAEAKKWRARILADKADERVVVPSRVRLDAAGGEFLDGIKSGRIKTRSGERYKPSTIRSYEDSLELHVYPDLGARHIGSITAGDIQALVERMSGDRNAGSTIANVVNPIRAIYRRLVVLGHVSVNPTSGVVLPTTRTKRVHAGDPAAAELVLAALPAQDRCAWALAYYAGLRLGELRALRWEDIDKKAGVIRIRRSWDVKEGDTLPKSSAGIRDIPILDRLQPHLDAQRAACPWSGDPEGLVLGLTRRTPLGYTGLRKRTAKALAAAKLPHVTLHEARHSFASYLAASGIGIKDLTVILGHSSVTVSLDRYGHLFEAGKAQTAAQINAWLEAADTGSRISQLDGQT